MRKLIKSALVATLVAGSGVATGAVTEFEDIALDGAGTTPFIRFDLPELPSKYIVGFNDSLQFYSGSSYSLKLFGDAPADALVVDGDGVQIRTDLEIHDVNNGSLKFRLSETDQEMGIVTLSSTLGLHDGGIGFMNDVSTYPFYVFNTAQSGTLAVSEPGVSIGNYDPESALHVYADGFPMTEAKVIVENQFLAEAPRTLLELRNPGNTKFELFNTDAGESWAFTNSGVDFRVSLQDSGVVEFRVDNDGNAFVAGDMTLGGTLLEMSDRNQKHAVRALDHQAILDRITAMPVTEWSYLDQPDSERHIGPMAQDFHTAFGLAGGETRISARDMAGVSLVGVQALAARNQALESEVATLRQELEDIKAMILKSTPRVTAN